MRAGRVNGTRKNTWKYPVGFFGYMPTDCGKRRAPDMRKTQKQTASTIESGSRIIPNIHAPNARGDELWNGTRQEHIHITTYGDCSPSKGGDAGIAAIV